MIYLVAICATIFNFGIRSVQNSEPFDWSIHKPQSCYGDDNYTLQRNEPIKVYLSINVIDLFDVSEDRMEFGLQTSIYDIWKDPTLKLDGVKTDKPINVPKSVARCIWKPDIIFPNSKDSLLFDTTVPNTVITLVDGGYFLRYSRFRLKISCQMHFHNYPMDTQRCSVYISMIYSKVDVATLNWFRADDESPPYVQDYKICEVYKGAQPLQFAMGPPKVESGVSVRKIGNTSQLTLKFKFARHLTASIINTYIPSSLVVCLSWVSFWIEPSAVPGRVTLGVTALLTLATEIVHARSLLPPVDYMTAMDVWLFGCLLMVFSSLIEFTLAYTLSRRQEIQGATSRVVPSPAWSINEAQKPDQNPSQPTTPAQPEPILCKDCCNKSNAQGWTLLVVMNVNNHLIELPSGWKVQTAKPPAVVTSHKTNSFDMVSRILFPLVLIVFGVVYWSYYASQITNLEDVDFKSR